MHANSVTDIMAVEAIPLEQLDDAAVKKGLADFNNKLVNAKDDYEKAAAQIGIEVCGAMNQNCVDLVKQASKLLSNELAQGTSTTWTASSFASFHQQRISIALQRASNAKAIRCRALRDFQASGFTGTRRS